MLTGRCLCGAVRYELLGRPGQSPLYSRRADEPDSFRIRLGTLGDDPGRRAWAHFHVSSKASWYDITDGLPEYSEGSIENDPEE